jgi:class 3 adenylate cyclase
MTTTADARSRFAGMPAPAGGPDLSRNPLSLHFRVPALEREFRNEQTRLITRTLIETSAVAFVLAVLATLGTVFGLREKPDGPMGLLLIGSVAATGLFWFVAWKSRRRPTPLLNTIFALSIAFSVAVASPAIVAVVYPEGVLVGYGYSGLVLLSICIFFLLRLPLLEALALNAATIVTYGELLKQVAWLPPLHVVFHLACAAMGMIASAAGGWYLEKLARDNFAQRALLAWREREITFERERSETLLRNILPEPIAERLKTGESPIADGPMEVTVVFADIVGFTPLATLLPAHETVALLDELFTGFDGLAARLGVEKIKTIGDAYMVVAGLPILRADHTDLAARLALDMREYVRAFQTVRGHRLEVRIGLDTGPVVAGVIGRQKFAYDLWGDAVNTASRMESHGAPDRIHVTEKVAARLAGRFQFAPRGEIEVKGKGSMQTYWLESESA